MFFQPSDTIEASSKFISEKAEVKANLEIISAAVEVLRSVAALEAGDSAVELTQAFADRLITAAYASGTLALCGCYEAAAEHICEIIEIGFLIELFRLMPSEGERWRGYSLKLRVKYFPPHRTSGKLNKLDPKNRGQRASAYAYTTRHGLHCGGRIPINQMGPLELEVDETTLLQLSADLSRQLASATLQVASALRGKIAASGAAAAHYHRRVRTVLRLLETPSLR